MKVFVIGVSGAVGGLVAERLIDRGATVGGLVRQREQRERLSSIRVDATVGDLGSLTVSALANILAGAHAVLFAAGSNGGPVKVTNDIDGDGVVKALAAASMAGVPRFLLLSVLPEAWRERELGKDLDHYFSVKKRADVAVSRSSLDWLVLRPSLLLDGSGRGTISLGPAELHGAITRVDVADTLVELLHEHRISRRVLELNSGSTPIRVAVHANVPVEPRTSLCATFPVGPKATAGHWSGVRRTEQQHESS